MEPLLDILVLGSCVWRTWYWSYWYLSWWLWLTTWENQCVLQRSHWWQVCAQSCTCRLGTRHYGLCSIRTIRPNFQAWQLRFWYDNQTLGSSLVPSTAKLTFHINIWWLKVVPQILILIHFKRLFRALFSSHVIYFQKFNVNGLAMLFSISSRMWKNLGKSI